MLKLFFNRLKNTLRFVPHQIEMNRTWEFETCERCGRPFHICWWTSNDLWKKYNGHPDGSGDLCPDCFIELCAKAGRKLKDDEIKMVPFQPDCNKETDYNAKN